MKISSIQIGDKAAKVILDQLGYKATKTVQVEPTKKEAAAGKPGKTKEVKNDPPESFIKEHLVKHLRSIHSDALQTQAHQELMKKAKSDADIS